MITLISPVERLRLCKRDEGREGGREGFTEPCQAARKPAGWYMALAGLYYGHMRAQDGAKLDLFIPFSFRATFSEVLSSLFLLLGIELLR